jgi:CDP-glucose 4,6-dehydratase
MKIAVTGHTGFKGTWFSYLMSRYGHKLYGYSNEIPQGGIFEIGNAIDIFEAHNIGDVRDLNNLNNFLNISKPEVLIHFAAQPLVLKSYINQFATYETNVGGTLNILEAVAKSEECHKIIVVTSDKVYKHVSINTAFKEESSLGGQDPYSNSKAMADLLSQSWKFNNPDKKIVIVRAGNVIGPGDISENRLIPDIIRAVQNREKLIVRNRYSVRPWQYVLDCLLGYYEVIRKLKEIPNNSAWNIGPKSNEAFSVEQIVELFRSNFPELEVGYASSKFQEIEMGSLLIDSDKAAKALNWSPKYQIADAIREISSWEKGLMDGASPKVLINSVLENYLIQQ